jgi:hypothetical protein
MRSLVWPLAFFALACLVTPVHAEGGWKMPSLNPFKKSGPPTSARVSDDSSGIKMPKLWPSTGKTIVKKPAGPSTWQKFKSGSKSVWNKTADALNPFDDANDKPEPIEVTGSNSFVNQVANRKQPASGKPGEKKPSTFLPSWWTSEDEEPKTRTVQDFLKQPRPGF